jgi:hypothetical protein
MKKYRFDVKRSWNDLIILPFALEMSLVTSAATR